MINSKCTRYSVLKTDMDNRSIVQKLGSFIVHRINIFFVPCAHDYYQKTKVNEQWNAPEQRSHGMITIKKSKLKSHHPSRSIVRRSYYNNNNFSVQITIIGLKGSALVPNVFSLRKFEHFTNREQDNEVENQLSLFFF